MTDLYARTRDPFVFRLIFSPLMASIIGFRAGWKDAHQSRPPYVWSLFTLPHHRTDLLKGGWRDIARLFLVALCVDTILQLIIRRWVYPLEAATVAVTLAIVPYVVFRSFVNRAATKIQERR